MQTDEIAICHVIRMEVLSGARDETHLLSLRRLLARATLIPTVATDYDGAAALHRRCRRQGETVLKPADCRLGTVAIRNDLPILHYDADFEVLSRNTELEVTPVARR